MIRGSFPAPGGLPVLLLVLGPAVAAAPGAGTDATLEALCSGARLEFEAPALERFDDDGDRVISEREAERCESLAAVFERLDLDADGTLSRVEYGAFADVWRRRQRVFTDPD